MDVDGDGAVERLENDNATSPKPFTPTACGNRAVAIPDVYINSGINNGERLASTVSTRATLLPAGTYYAKVMSRATVGTGRNLAAGELGSYDLAVILQ
jgi:hypothetical protein